MVFLCLRCVVFFFFFFSSRRRHTRFDCDWSSDVCSSDLLAVAQAVAETGAANDLLERLGRDPAFRRLGIRATPDEREPASYVGRAPQQGDEFLEEVLPPVLRQIEAGAPVAAAAEVTV